MMAFEAFGGGPLNERPRDRCVVFRSYAWSLLKLVAVPSVTVCAVYLTFSALTRWLPPDLSIRLIVQEGSE